jgi:RNA polymerase sigma-54 factor
VPKLHITNLYRQAASFDDDTQKYIKKRLSAATWLINSIEQRRETIRKVVEELVRVQREFLDKGPAYLKPLTMKEVAEAIEVHESTVSRAVANKYAEIPGGLMPLKGFFQTGLGKAGSGEDFLASQAKAELERLIKGEDPRKPLSDQKLCELLKAKDMDISRRTVMKYREQLGYPSSVKRKRY